MQTYRVGVSRVSRVVDRTTIEVQAESPEAAVTKAEAVLEDTDDVVDWRETGSEALDYSYCARLKGEEE